MPFLVRIMAVYGTTTAARTFADCAAVGSTLRLQTALLWANIIQHCPLYIDIYSLTLVQCAVRSLHCPCSVLLSNGCIRRHCTPYALMTTALRNTIHTITQEYFREYELSFDSETLPFSLEAAAGGNGSVVWRAPGGSSSGSVPASGAQART
jgi:hypothetical protein